MEGAGMESDKILVVDDESNTRLVFESEES